MKVCVVGGAGYVGLITGLGLAEIGHCVTNVDVVEDRIHKLGAGESPVYEEGLEYVLRRNLAAGRVRFSTDLQEAMPSSDVVFVAVGTPSQKDGQADFSQVIEVAKTLAMHLDTYKVIALKSTVPVGTVELVRSILNRQKREGPDFDIVVNPEFLREGKGLYDFFYPDRIVLGSCSDKATRVMRTLYEPILLGRYSWPEALPRAGSTCPVPLVETDLTSAQMIKYASNAFLATRISFVNEIAGLCEKVDADIKEVARGMGYDSRIGHSYLEAGLGFGGPCLEKDLQALIKIAEGNGYEPPLLKAVLERNGRQVRAVIGKLKHLIGHMIYNKTIAVFGLAFKAGTNDVRDSLALRVIGLLENEGAIVKAYDPLAIPEAQSVRPHGTYCEDPYEAVQHASALLILTDWPCFSQLDYPKIKALMSFPCIVDGRNLLDAAGISALGFTYVGVGRPWVV